MLRIFPVRHDPVAVRERLWTKRSRSQWQAALQDRKSPKELQPCLQPSALQSFPARSYHDSKQLAVVKTEEDPPNRLSGGWRVEAVCGSHVNSLSGRTLMDHTRLRHDASLLRDSNQADAQLKLTVLDRFWASDYRR